MTEDRRSYLDHNATSPVRPDARDGCLSAFDHGGNPSSVHREGRGGRAIVERARRQVGALAGSGFDVVFTSGGTEANATALRPGALLTGGGRPVERLVLGATEHASVRSGHGFAAAYVEVLPVDRAGLVDGQILADALRRSDLPTLVSLQAANSETGVLQPVPEIAAIVREAGAVLHVDAVQAAGRLPGDAWGMGDALSLSGHKLGALMGSGALLVRPDRLAAGWLRGGGQERGLRSGTENVPGIAAFGAAAEAAEAALADGEAARLRALRDRAERIVRDRAPDAVVFGADAPRLPNTLAFAVPGVKAETALMLFDLAGIAVSSGSACTSGKVGRSHVLAAMGVPAELASGAIRVSFGWNSVECDVERFAEGFDSVLHRLYERDRARAA